MLAAEGICYSYPGSSGRVIDNVSCRIVPGQVVALMGASGSGKTTLARLLAGVLQPLNGSLVLNGKKYHTGVPGSVLRRSIGLVLSEPDFQLIGETVFDELAFGLASQKLAFGTIKERVAAALRQAGMEDYANYPPRFLSGGQKQKLLMLAFSLLDTEYLILDEPFQMLDQEGRRLVGNFIKGLGKETAPGILFTTHIIDDALWLADRIILMDKGRICAEWETSRTWQHTAQLVDAGVRPPEIALLAQLLRQKGLPIGDDITEPGVLAEEIWRCWFKD